MITFIAAPNDPFYTDGPSGYTSRRVYVKGVDMRGAVVKLDELYAMFMEFEPESVKRESSTDFRLMLDARRFEGTIIDDILAKWLEEKGDDT